MQNRTLSNCAYNLANGTIPEDKKGVSFKQWKQNVVKHVRSRTHDYERTRSQLVAYFAPTLMSDADVDNRENVRKVANTICMFLAKQEEKNKSKQSLIQGRNEDGSIEGAEESSTGPAAKFQGQSPYGKHAALVRAGKQKEADEYALIRYFAYINMYDAIPNPDDGESKEEGLIPAINTGQEALVEKMIQQAANAAALEATQTWVDNNLGNKCRKVAEEENNTTHQKISEKYFLVRRAHDGLASTSYTNVRVWVSENQSYISEVKKHIPVSFSYNKEVVGNAQDSFSVPHLNTLLTSDAQMDYRPHAFLKKQADKWLAKINAATSPLVKERALDTALFNPNLSPAGHRKLSFVFENSDDVSTGSSGAPDISGSKDLDKKLEEVNTLIDQLTLKFGSIIIKGNAPDLQKRLQSVLGFLEAKQAQILAKKENMRNERESNGKDKEVKGSEERNANQKAAHAFVKYISYTQLQFGLTHDSEGKLTPIFASVTSSPSMSSLSTSSLSRSQFGLSGIFTQSFMNMAYSLDDFFHQKAQKWGQRVVNSPSSFIKDNALDASLFR